MCSWVGCVSWTLTWVRREFLPLSGSGVSHLVVETWDCLECLSGVDQELALKTWISCFCPVMSPFLFEGSSLHQGPRRAVHYTGLEGITCSSLNAASFYPCFDQCGRWDRPLLGTMAVTRRVFPVGLWFNPLTELSVPEPGVSQLTVLFSLFLFPHLLSSSFPPLPPGRNVLMRRCLLALPDGVGPYKWLTTFRYCVLCYCCPWLTLSAALMGRAQE